MSSGGWLGWLERAGSKGAGASAAGPAGRPRENADLSLRKNSIRSAADQRHQLDEPDFAIRSDGQLFVEIQHLPAIDHDQDARALKGLDRGVKLPRRIDLSGPPRRLAIQLS